MRTPELNPTKNQDAADKAFDHALKQGLPPKKAFQAGMIAALPEIPPEHQYGVMKVAQIAFHLAIVENGDARQAWEAVGSAVGQYVESVYRSYLV